MWFRRGKRALWEGRDPGSDHDVREAANSLTPRGDEDVSVYRVENLEDALRVVAAYAATLTDRPDSVDMIVIPDAVFEDAGIEPRKVPTDDLPKYLGDRHYEIPGLDDEDLRLRVTRLALGSDALTVQRVKKADIKKQLTKHGVRGEPGMEESIRERWREYLDK